MKNRSKENKDKYILKFLKKQNLEKKKNENFINLLFRNKCRKGINLNLKREITTRKETKYEILERTSQLINNNKFFHLKRKFDKEIKKVLFNMIIDHEELTKQQLYILLKKLTLINGKMK